MGWSAARTLSTNGVLGEALQSLEWPLERDKKRMPLSMGRRGGNVQAALPTVLREQQSTRWAVGPVRSDLNGKPRASFSFRTMQHRAAQIVPRFVHERNKIVAIWAGWCATGSDRRARSAGGGTDEVKDSHPACFLCNRSASACVSRAPL